MRNGIKKGFIGIIIALIVAAAIIGVVIFKKSQADNKSVTTTEAPVAVEPETIDLKTVNLIGVDGKSAMDLLKDNTKVEYTDSATGVFITSINGIVNSNKEFWMYSVNGVDATVAADKYITKSGDQIKWEYR